MTADALRIVALGMLILAVTGVFTVVRRTRGLRRRLFVLLVVASVLPATAVFLGSWVIAQGVAAGVLGAGVDASTDAGLVLAREVLAREAEDLLAWTAATPSGAVAPGHGWVEVRQGAAVQQFGEDPLAVLEREPTLGPGEVRRVEREGGTLLVARVEDASSTRWGLRPLPPEVSGALRDLRRGSTGLRQMDLYYRELLLSRALLATTAILLLATVLALAVSGSIANRLIAPLGALVEGTRRVAAGDLGHRVAAPAVGELGELVQAFDGMTARLAESEKRLRSSERIAAWQGVARRLAHEIKNPLTPIRLAVHRLGKRSDDEVTLGALRAIDEETRNLERLAEEFSTLARLPQPQRQAVVAGPLLRECVELYLPHVTTELFVADEDLTLDADPGQLRQVMSNLCKNAMQAVGSGGRVRLRVLGHDARTARLVVEDDGPGLGDAPERVFEPYFTTKETGTGLGLAIARRIVEDHGGNIEAGVSEWGGAGFEILWPLHVPDREKPSE